MLTERGVQERKWRPFPALRRALEEKHLSEEYIGWTSVSDNIFEQLPRLLEIALLARDFKDCVGATARETGWEATHRDLEGLYDELDGLSRYLRQTADEVRALHGLECQAHTSPGRSE